MSTAERAGPQHTSPATSMAGVLLVGFALIVVVTGVFWTIGRTGDGGGDAPIIAEPTDTATPDEPTPPGDAPATLAASPTPTDLGTPTPTTSPEPTESETPSGSAPGDITVQVLDAAGDDGSAAEDAAEELREAGFVVVAVNRAVRTYESSTLFYTDGHEGDAHVVADEFSQFDVIDEAPDNLSSSVDLHAVVGMDWFAPGD